MKLHIEAAKRKLPLHEFLFVKATAPSKIMRLNLWVSRI